MMSDDGQCKAGKKSYIIGVIVAERYVKEFPSFYMDVYKRIAQEATKRGSMTIQEVVDQKKEMMEYRFAAFQGTDIAGVLIIDEMNRKYVEIVEKGVSNAMRSRIVETAKKMGYRMEKYEKKSQGATIGVIVAEKYLEESVWEKMENQKMSHIMPVSRKQRSTGR